MKNLILVLTLIFMPLSAGAVQYRLFNSLDSKQGLALKLGDTANLAANPDVSSTNRPSFSGANGTVFAISANPSGFRKVYYVDANGSLQQACNINASGHDVPAVTVQSVSFGVGFANVFYFVGLNSSGKQKVYYADIAGGTCAQAFDVNGASLNDYGLTDTFAQSTFISNGFLYVPVAVSGGSNFVWMKIDSTKTINAISAASSFPGGNATKSVYLFSNRIFYKSSTNTQIVYLDLSNDSFVKPLGAETTNPIIGYANGYLYFTRLNSNARAKLFRLATNLDVSSCGDLNGPATADVFAQGGIATFGNKNYLIATMGGGILKLFSDDGTSFTQVNLNSAGTADFNSVSVKFVPIGHKLYFNNMTGFTSKICYITLTNSTPVCLASSNFSTNTGVPIQAANSVVFAGLSGSNSKLYRFNFDDSATQLSNLSTSASDNADDFFFYNGRLYFTALSSGSARKLFRINFK